MREARCQIGTSESSNRRLIRGLHLIDRAERRDVALVQPNHLFAEVADDGVRMRGDDKDLRAADDFFEAPWLSP